MANIPGTNVPAVTWSGGFPILPTGPALLAGIQADISAAFGVPLNFQVPTPQGQLSTTFEAVTNNANQTFAFYAQQVDPAYASGRFQDAIGRITFQTRRQATATALQVACSGLGAPIPAGALVRDSAGNLYAATVGGTIPNSGSITIEFDAVIPGPTPVPSGSLTIYQAISGWDSATVSSGTVGTATETRAAFEARRQATVAKTSIGPIPAIRGEVLDVDGVTDAYVRANPTASPVTVLGVTIAAFATYTAVVGGADADVAAAIWRKKIPGGPYAAGNTTVAVQDSQSGYLPPFPTYNVTFERPPALQVLFAVNLVSTPQVPADAAVQVANAIAAAAVLSGEPTFLQIGGLVLANAFLPAIFALGPWVMVRSILVGSDDSPAVTFTGVIAGSMLTVTGASANNLVAGQWVFGFGVAGGTAILSQAGGTPGGNGTYNLNNAQTVSSTTMTAAAASAATLQVNANEAPQTSPPYVLVTVS